MKIIDILNQINFLLNNLKDKENINKINEFINKLIEKIKLIKQLKEEKNKFFKNSENFVILKIKFINIKNDLIDSINKENNCFKDKLINKELKHIDWEKIIKYTTKISNTIQGPKEYKKTSSMLPWSYNLNIIETIDIDNSNMNKTLKNNLYYEKCKLPEIIYKQDDLDLVISKNHHKIKYYEPINITLKKYNSKDIIFIKRNGSIPTLNDFEILTNNNQLFIPNTSLINIRVFQFGKLLSDIIKIEVNISNENRTLINLNRDFMIRNEEVDEDFIKEDFNVDIKEIFDSDNFKSLLNNDFFSNTPV